MHGCCTFAVLDESVTKNIVTTPDCEYDPFEHFSLNPVCKACHSTVWLLTCSFSLSTNLCEPKNKAFIANTFLLWLLNKCKTVFSAYFLLSKTQDTTILKPSNDKEFICLVKIYDAHLVSVHVPICAGAYMQYNQCGSERINSGFFSQELFTLLLETGSVSLTICLSGTLE